MGGGVVTLWGDFTAISFADFITDFTAEFITDFTWNSYMPQNEV